MRVLIGAIGHESNTFTPLPTTMADFSVSYGQQMLDRPMGRSAIDGIVSVLRAQGVELVPTLVAGAMPGGVVEQSAYQTFKQAVLAEAHDVDGACLFLHGAMRAQGVDYCENDLLCALRARLGPAVPIVVALDMHANLVADMAETVDALVTYRTAPHVDRFETGERAAEMLLQILEQGIQTEIGFAKLPFLLPGEMAQTALDPMAAVMGMVEQVEAHPDVLSASVAKGHCWADVPDIGVVCAVVTEGDAALAQAEADRLAAAFWEQRADFGMSAEAYPVDEAIDAAMQAPESTVFLSDSGDNPGAGGTTDVPIVLSALLAKGASSVVVASIWDAEAVQACVEAGIGQSLTLSIGGKLDVRHGTPVQVTGRVRTLTDGAHYQGGVRTMWDRQKMGIVAVLNVAGIDVILSSTRLSFVDPVQLCRLGLEPLEYRIVVLKRGYLTAPFQAISQRAILALSPGATNCDVTQLAYRRVNRPMYPLDPDAVWSPGT